MRTVAALIDVDAALTVAGVAGITCARKAADRVGARCMLMAVVYTFRALVDVTRDLTLRGAGGKVAAGSRRDQLTVRTGSH